MTRRPVQQARRITDKQLVDWPAPLHFEPDRSRATWRDVREIVGGTLVLILCFVAIVAALFVASGMAS
jgi:hypothetical protein